MREHESGTPQYGIPNAGRGRGITAEIKARQAM